MAKACRNACFSVDCQRSTAFPRAVTRLYGRKFQLLEHRRRNSFSAYRFLPFFHLQQMIQACYVVTMAMRHNHTNIISHRHGANVVIVEISAVGRIEAGHSCQSADVRIGDQSQPRQWFAAALSSMAGCRALRTSATRRCGDWCAQASFLD